MYTHHQIREAAEGQKKGHGTCVTTLVTLIGALSRVATKLSVQVCVYICIVCCMYTCMHMCKYKSVDTDRNNNSVFGMQYTSYVTCLS